MKIFNIKFLKILIPKNEISDFSKNRFWGEKRQIFEKSEISFFGIKIIKILILKIFIFGRKILFFGTEKKS